MKNKKVLMTGISLALVGVIGIGATLAYLTDNTGPVTNTFTIGKGYIDEENSPALVLDEKVVGKTTADSNFRDRTIKGNSYEFLPGNTYEKDPDVHLRTDSVDSYIFVKITGLDELLSVANQDGVKYYTGVIFNSNNWRKVDETKGYNGIYTYTISSKYMDPTIINSTNITATEEDSYEVDYFNLQPIFTELTPNNEITKMGGDKLNNVVIKACAVQATNNTYESALEQAKGILK